MTALPITVLPIAEFAVAEAAAAYEAVRPGYRVLFFAALGVVKARIEIFPESHAAVLPEVRRALFPPPFPFGVLYRITPRELVIVDVLPTAANPARWTMAAHR